MGGFSLEGFEGRVPCPHCSDTDCAGLIGRRGRKVLGCCRAQRPVTTRQLRESATANGLVAYRKVAAFEGVVVNLRKNPEPGTPSYFAMSGTEGHLGDGRMVSEVLLRAVEVLESRKQNSLASRLRARVAHMRAPWKAEPQQPPPALSDEGPDRLAALEF